ncbi:MAG: glycosyl hydrolase [Armatimonadetes bacterium]|nr:glycosyl hydrolase [Armatimonadota bacterium]
MEFAASILAAVALLAGAGVAASAAPKAGPGIPTPESRTAGFDVLPGFRTPPPGYGEIPYWWWTGDRLDKDRLLWQLDELKRKGITGVQVNYSHDDTAGWPTSAVQPPIFSREWFDTWSWMVGECRKRGMGIGISGYTLDWPGHESNLFGKTVYGDRETQGQELTVTQQVACQAGQAISVDVPADAVAVRAYRLEGAVSARGGADLSGHVKAGKLTWTPPDGSWQVWVVAAQRKPLTLNPLHPLSGRRVIERFFQPCESHTPGGTSAGLNYFFQDELQFGVGRNQWVEDFALEFRKRKGYDLMEALPALFGEMGKETPKVRMDYMDVRVALAEERYFRPIFEWHQQRGLIYACDPGGRGRDPGEFGDYFRAVRWYSAPGHDTPGGNADLIKGKVSSSIAHLYQRPRVWLEGYHSLGWGATPERLLRATRENYLFGCSLLNLHGLYYTTHGGFWEWAPPCYHFRMPYWDHFGTFLKYFERLSYLLTQGVHRCDVAVMYPVAPYDADLSPGEATSVAFGAGERLFAGGYDFDFMDHQSLERATVRDGRLHVAGEAYRALVLPAMRAVRWSTLQKALAFRRAGGIVVALGALPSASDRAGREDPALDQAVQAVFGSEAGAQAQALSVEALMELLKQRLPRQVEAAPQCRSLHRRIGPCDVYMVMDAAAGAEVLFRGARGKAEVWDPWTGSSVAIEVVSQGADGVRVRMPMTGEDTHIIVFSPEPRGEPRPAARKAPATAAAEIVKLDGDWEFEMKPTCDNRWGDFRLPASAGMIGPEARTFRTAQEVSPNPGWQAADMDDTGWAKVTHGFGQQMWKLGPLPDDAETASLDAALASLRAVDPTAEVTVGGRRYRWQPYAFSWRWGLEGDPGHQGWHGLKENVTDDFICLGSPTGGMNETLYTREGDGGRYYLWTSAAAGRDMQATIRSGGLKPAALYLNGARVVDGQPQVALKAGSNPLLLRYDQPGRGHFVLVQSGAPAPSQRTPLAMSWYDAPGRVPFDAWPGESAPAAWYRFTAPPGLRSFALTTRGSLRAWADVVECRVTPVGPGRSRVELAALAASQAAVALRIEQERGCYGGAAIPEPVALDCGPGRMKLGDWSQAGALESYSGGAWYRKTFALTQAQAAGTVRLNLGDVAATAEVRINGKSAGVRVAPPWSFDLTGKVKAGDNRIEALVYNTLANHYLTIPTRYRGSPRSGLIGPVTLEVGAAGR